MAELEYAGVKASGSKLLLIFPLLSALGGAGWYGFTLYQEFLDLRATVSQYEPPDITGVEQSLAVLNEHMSTVNTHMDFVGKELDLFSEEMGYQKESLEEQIAYVKEVKVDVRQDMKHLEDIVDDVETKLQNQKSGLIEIIDNATERFDDRRDSLYTDTDRKIKELEERLNSKLQRALDNPLAN
jgi:hypothetical protein